MRQEPAVAVRALRYSLFIKNNFEIIFDMVPKFWGPFSFYSFMKNEFNL